MYIFSEKTNKKYDTVEECVKAEAEFDKKIDEENKAREKLIAEQKARAEEVENSINKTNELLKSYLKDYGTFRTSTKSTYNLIDWIDKYLFW